MGKPPLAVENLEKRFGRVRALAGVSFSVDEGEIFGYLGPNGAGKTTTLRLVLGLVRATAGRAFVFGRPAGAVRAREDVGYLPGELALYGNMTGRALLDYVAAFRPGRTPALRARLEEALGLGAAVVTAVLAGFEFVIVMGAAGAAATWLGQRAYGLNVLRPGTIAALAANFVLLQSAWFGVTLLLSVFGREAGRVAFGGFLAALLSYLAQVIGGMWARAAFLLPYSPYTYDDPRVVLRSGGIPLRSVLVLAGIAAVCIGAAFGRFRKRDIP